MASVCMVSLVFCGLLWLFFLHAFHTRLAHSPSDFKTNCEFHFGIFKLCAIFIFGFTSVVLHFLVQFAALFAVFHGFFLMWLGYYRYLSLLFCYVFSVSISRPSFSIYSSILNFEHHATVFCSRSRRGTQQRCHYHQSSWWNPFYLRNQSCGRKPSSRTSWASAGVDVSQFSSTRTLTSSL